MIEEEVKLNSKEKVKDGNETSLGETNVEAEKSVEESKVTTQAMKKKKESSSPWNFFQILSILYGSAKVKKEMIF